MMKNVIKNICLIGFALIGPITLPAGGIQRNLNAYNILNSSKEIILNTNCSLYTFPKINAKKLLILDTGSSLSVLQKWVVKENDTWARVESVSYTHLTLPTIYSV